MKKIIVTAAILCATFALQGKPQINLTHTFTNDSNLPIQVSLLYDHGTHSDDQRIEPHTSYTFHTKKGGVNIKRIDVRDAGKDKILTRSEFITRGNTEWRFNIAKKKGILFLISGEARPH